MCRLAFGLSGPPCFWGGTQCWPTYTQLLISQWPDTQALMDYWNRNRDQDFVRQHPVLSRPDSCLQLISDACSCGTFRGMISYDIHVQQFDPKLADQLTPSQRPGHRPDESRSTCDSCRWCRVTPQKELLHIHTGQCSCRRMLTMGFADATVCDWQSTLRWCDMGHTGRMGRLVANWTIFGVMAGHRSLGKPDGSEAVQGWNATGRWVSWGTCLP